MPRRRCPYGFMTALAHLRAAHCSAASARSRKLILTPALGLTNTAALL